MRSRRVTLAAFAVLSGILVLIAVPTSVAQRPRELQPDLACFEPELPHQLGRRTHAEVPDYAVVPARLRSESAAYDLVQDQISFFGAPGSAPLLHGRQDVLANSELIRRFAVQDLELIVAASIAHQASDIKDRPFGADAVETFVLENVNPDASVGIAQLRPSEVVYWAPELIGADLLEPEIAVRVMTAKLEKADHYIARTYPEASVTDRTMLLALAQNDSSEIAMHKTIGAFFVGAGRLGHDAVAGAGPVTRLDGTTAAGPGAA
ncbi:MAG: hypothetical protein R2844_13040 [Caldilineales bacterium]